MTALNECFAAMGKMSSSHIQCLRCYTDNVTEASLMKNADLARPKAKLQGLVGAKRSCTMCASSAFQRVACSQCDECCSTGHNGGHSDWQGR